MSFHQNSPDLSLHQMLCVSQYKPSLGHSHVLLALAPVLPSWPCFVLSVLEGQLAKRVLGGDVTAVLVTATLTFTHHLDGSSRL